MADSGSQHPFEMIYYTRALASGSQTYTAGTNLFGNGVPLRACRSGQLRSIRWPEARSGPHVRPTMITLLWPTRATIPSRATGRCLLRVSLEEVTGAIVHAIAKEIWPWKQLFRRVVSGASLAPKLAPWSVDMSDKGVLQVVWALLLCDRNRQLLKESSSTYELKAGLYRDC